jgi:hypothetical protein
MIEIFFHLLKCGCELIDCESSALRLIQPYLGQYKSIFHRNRILQVLDINFTMILIKMPWTSCSGIIHCGRALDAATPQGKGVIDEEASFQLKEQGMRQIMKELRGTKNHQSASPFVE